MRRVTICFNLIVTFLLVWVVTSHAQLTPMETLGKELFFDKISQPDWMSCAACHAPSVGWTGPIPGINQSGAVYRGAVPERFGNRKPPSSGYATFAPNFGYDLDEELFFGGNFWDGRATGDKLGNPAADQALGPFLNPVEMNNPSKLAVLQQVATAKYAPLWEVVWGEPLTYETEEEIEDNYDKLGLAIAAYEASNEVNSFSSKFDLYEAGEVALTPLEEWGMELFNGKALCSACHPAPLFTDFTYDNLGIPRNPENPFYNMDEVFIDGEPINPEGENWIDPGLGGFLASLPEAYFTELGLDKEEAVAANEGKHKVPTLRNVGKASGKMFPKAFGHNGFFKSLEEIVHFYNTRDVVDWPPPEVDANVNDTELGDLGLTEAEEDAIVAFLETLSDGFKAKGNKKLELASDGSLPVAGLRLVGPNPFNPSTRIAYGLPEASTVKIQVYDMSGHRVATLQNGWQPSGEYHLDWTANDLASGHYVIRLQYGDRIYDRKVTLLK